MRSNPGYYIFTKKFYLGILFIGLLLRKDSDGDMYTEKVISLMPT